MDKLTEKIVSLVPEIKERKYYDQGEIVANEPSITLADVLRAIPEGHWKIYMSIDKPAHLVFSDFHVIARWNLSADLNGQSAETKAFLSKILGV